MDRLLQIFPQWFVALLILIAGVIFLYVVNPPHSVCDAQLEVFKSTQTPFLFKDAKKKFETTSGLQKSVDACKGGATNGACRELFDGLRRFVLDVKVVPSECTEKLSSLSEVKAAIWPSLELFTQLAWGQKAPASNADKLGWYDSFHLHTICSLKRFGTEIYGEETWASFVTQTLEKLPQADQLGRTESWNRSVLSINCDRYR